MLSASSGLETLVDVVCIKWVETLVDVVCIKWVGD